MISCYSDLLGIDLSNRSRKREYSCARFAVFYFLSEKKKMGNTQIAGIFNYTRANVIHGTKSFADLISINDPIAVSCWDKLKGL